MTRILKIYEPDPTALAAAGATTIETYPAFVVVEVEDAAVEAVTAGVLCEDITDDYILPAGSVQIDTSQARVTGAGTAEHPHYDGVPPLPRGRHHYLVQFIGPIKKPWLTAVRKAGAEVVKPYEGFAIVVRATATVAQEISDLRIVRWVGHLPYEARIAPETARQVGDDEPTRRSVLTPRTYIQPGAYNVEFFTPERAREGLGAVRRLGFEIVEDSSDAALLVVHTKRADDAQAAQIDKLSKVHGVSRIARRASPRTSNDQAAAVMGVVRAKGVPPGVPGALGLDGKGEIIGVCDTGLDTGDPANIHADFIGRIRAIRSYPIQPSWTNAVRNPNHDDGPADLDSGHGTHTSGSVLGSGVASSNLSGLAGPVRGLAHAAELVFQAVEQEVIWRRPDPNSPRFALLGIPSDLRDLFAWSYAQGVRVHSNSWGGGDPGEYDSQCRQLDAFVWSKPDFCVLFSAGNDGVDANGDGRIDLGSVTAPGVAKNCITVGASENNRPNINHTYGEFWPRDYPANPIRSDKLANNPDQIVAFSSRGPTLDGRIKPDVVAPGTYVLSTRSRRIASNNFGYGRYQNSSLYMFDSGTSMSTPLTAGAVGLIRQYIRKLGIANPSAALLKAALIAGAQPITGPAGAADNDQGFGRVNLDAVLAPPAPLRTSFFENRGLSTGALGERVVTLKSSGPLKVVLAYADFPGERLVNNLNLVLRSPTGQAFIGNSTAGVAPAFDTRNNVERIFLPVAQAGPWRIQVVASNVPQGPQPYALVVIAPT